MSNRGEMRGVTEAGSSATRPVDIAVEVLLAALLAFAPLALGAVEPWSEMAVMGMGAGLAGLLALRWVVQFRDKASSESITLSWLTVVVIVIYLAWVLLQLVPLPGSIVRVVSPKTAEMKTELLGDLPSASSVLKTMTLSFYPLGTRRDLGLVLLATVVFLAVVNICREERRMRRLLMWVAIVGGAIAIVALAQDATRSRRIYWMFPTPMGKPATSGPFVNHSHFAQFMNLSIGAALALVLATVSSGERQRRRAWVTIAWTGSVVVLGIVTVAISLSRGGLLSMLAAGAFTVVIATLALGWRRMRTTLAAILVIGIIGFGGVLYLGFDRVYDRLAKEDTAVQGRGRVQMTVEALRAWRDFAVTGVGLGAHEMVYPVYERAPSPSIASHVENEYAQALEETGIIGLACVIGFACIVWWRYGRAVKQRDHTDSPMLALGLGYGLAAVMLHSLTDFGQHLPAVACLSAATCGIIVNLGRKPEPSSQASASAGWHGALVLSNCALLVWTFVGTISAYRADNAWAIATNLANDLRARDWRGPEPAFEEMVNHARRAVQLEPGNIEYRRWLGTYEWRALEHARTDPSSGDVRLSKQDLAEVARIVDDLNQARRLAPTYGPIYYVVGQLEQRVLDRPIGGQHIRTAYALWRNDTEAALLAGEVDAREGKWREVEEKFRRVVQIEPGLFPRVVDTYLTKTSEPQRVLDLYAGDWQRMLWTSNALSKAGAGALAGEAHTRAGLLLKPLADRADATLDMLFHMAEVCMTQQKFDEAIGYYERALKLDDHNAYLRLRRARALVYLGRIEEARREVESAQKLDPEQAKAFAKDFGLRL